MNDVMEPYGSNGLREDAKRLRDVMSKVATAKNAVGAEQDDVDEATNELTDVLDEVQRRLDATTAVRHPEFDLDYPDVDEAEDCARIAADDPSQESVDALADALDDAAAALGELNRDAQDTARGIAPKPQTKPRSAPKKKPRSGRKITMADVDRIWRD